MSQKQQILAHLKNGQTLTAISALSLYGCFRLSARINELRQSGHDIESKFVTRNGKKFSRYKLIHK